ncbi:hypothetical protein [Mesorhizobium sp. B3-2-1]|uniref:hypothetical protein n=1 Tax=Mesorhizobium sp. B3-2-1 TaxID=2589891 RepID=UPI0015E27BDB|nr:hypothetical protein [Mesorhizobium sp. B3-2-1]
MTGTKFSALDGLAPALPAAMPIAKTPRGKAHAPVADDMPVCGLLPGSSFGRQIPRDFEPRSNLVHSWFLPALLHRSLLFCQPEKGPVISASAYAMARPSREKWTNETLASETTKK